MGRHAALCPKVADITASDSQVFLRSEDGKRLLYERPEVSKRASTQVRSV